MIKFRFLILGLLTFAVFLTTNYNVYAVDATQSSDLKSKIDALKKEVASKAASLKLEVNKRLQNKAIKGKVAEVNGNNIVVNTLKGSKTLVTNEYTTFEDNGKLKKNMTIKDISKDDNVIGLGDMDDKNQLTTKKLIRLPSKSSYLPKVVWGQVTRVSNNVLTIKLKSTEKVTLNTTSDTTFRLGNEDASILDAKLNMFIAGIRESSESADLRFVYVIPSGGYIKPEKKQASPSATPSTKPSPSPTEK